MSALISSELAMRGRNCRPGEQLRSGSPAAAARQSLSYVSPGRPTTPTYRNVGSGAVPQQARGLAPSVLNAGPRGVTYRAESVGNYSQGRPGSGQRPSSLGFDSGSGGGGPSPHTRNRAASLTNATSDRMESFDRMRAPCGGKPANSWPTTPERWNSSVRCSVSSSAMGRQYAGLRRPDRHVRPLKDLMRETDYEFDEMQAALALSLEEAKDRELLEKQTGAESEDLAMAMQEEEIANAYHICETDDAGPHNDDVDAQTTSGAQEALNRSSKGCLRDVRSNVETGLARTFAPRRWLTDASISFAYECIANPPDSWENNLFQDLGKIPEDILLIDAATTFWLAMQTKQSAVCDMLAPLKIEERKLVLCPLNDSRERGRADGGTHWGLLVWDRRSIDANPCDALSDRAAATPPRNSADERSVGRFIYYDSGGFLRGSSQLQANRLASKLAGRLVRATVGRCPKQTNGYDCGMYALLFSKIIVNYFLQNDVTQDPAELRSSSPPWEKRMMHLTPADVTAQRASFCRLLKDAAEEVPVVARGGG